MTYKENLADTLIKQAEALEHAGTDPGSAKLMRLAAAELCERAEDINKVFDFYWSDGRPTILNPMFGRDARNFANLSLRDTHSVLGLKPGATHKDEQGNTWKRREARDWSPRS